MFLTLGSHLDREIGIGLMDLNKLKASHIRGRGFICGYGELMVPTSFVAIRGWGHQWHGISVVTKKAAGVAEDGKTFYYNKNGETTSAPTDEDKQDLGSAFIPKFTYGITF